MREKMIFFLGGGGAEDDEGEKKLYVRGLRFHFSQPIQIVSYNNYGA